MRKHYKKIHSHFSCCHIVQCHIRVYDTAEQCHIFHSRTFHKLGTDYIYFGSSKFLKVCVQCNFSVVIYIYTMYINTVILSYHVLKFLINMIYT